MEDGFTHKFCGRPDSFLTVLDTGGTSCQVQDVASGATTRPHRESLIASARRREIDGVLVLRRLEYSSFFRYKSVLGDGLK